MPTGGFNYWMNQQMNMSGGLGVGIGALGGIMPSQQPYPQYYYNYATATTCPSPSPPKEARKRTIREELQDNTDKWLEGI